MPERPTDPSALLTAADLGFAVGDTEEALADLRAAVTELGRRTTDLRSVALAGAVAGVVRTQVRERGFLIRFAPGRGVERDQRHVALAPTPADMWVTLDLVLACLASPASGDDGGWRALSPEWAPLPPDDALVHALSAFGIAVGVARGRPEAIQHALWANAARWASHVWLQQEDRHHWERARVRGWLIDMRRLAFEIAVRRHADSLVFAETLHVSEPRDAADGLQAYATALAEEVIGLG